MTPRRAPALVLLMAASGAEAHGFGQRYDLPLPLELYVCGAALTVLATCILFAFFVRAPGPQGYPRWDLLATAPGRLLASPVFVGAIRLVALALLALVIFAGFFGNQNPFKNVAPVAVWALGWVGLAYVSALVGDIWKVANPFDTAFAALARWSSRRGRPFTPRWTPPPWLQAWPAVAIYLVFLWFEIAWSGSESPRGIAAVIVVYALVTWAGMAAFGRERWLDSGEVFSLVFGIFARFAPIHVELSDRRVSAWHLRPYAVGLFARDPLDASRIALVIVILAAVTFDGFLETPAWAAIAQGIAPEDASWPRSAGLVFAPLLFAAIYLAFCRLIALGGGTDPRGSRARIAGLFVLTLVPIAIGYQVAHYFSFLVQAVQYLVPLASDPFGWGWNLFMTAHWFVRVNVVDARVVWIASVAAIVAGHVAALYLAHSLSMREFHDRRAAMRSQGPMLVLMVAYTMSSLWIIAQPIVSTR